MAGGQQITSGQGTVTAGAAGSAAVTGSASTGAAGTQVPSTSVRLLSRKVGGGTGTQSLSGSAFTSAAGLFTPVPSKTPTGQVASLLQGSVVPSRTAPMVGSAVSVQSGAVSNGAAGTLEADWIARSTAAGVFYSQRFNTSGAVTPFLDGNAGNDGRTVVWEQTIKRSGAGAARINIPDGYGANPGAVILPWGRTVGSGSVYYVQFSVFIPQSLLRYKPHFSAGQGGATSAGEGGNKFAIISAYPPGSSASNNAVVINNHEYRGFPVTYWYDGISGVVQGQELRSVAGGTNNNFVWENKIDKGSPASPSTQNQYEQRYGPLWHNDSLPQQGLPVQDTDIYSAGFPSPSGHVGCPFWLENGWNTVTVEITFVTLGSANNRLRVWACQPGGSNLLLQDWQNIQFGTDNGGHTGIWLTPYDTNRDYYGRKIDTFVIYAEVIASTNFINPPAVSSNAVWTPPYTIPAVGAVQAIGTNTILSVTPSGMLSASWNYATGASYSGGTMLNEYSVGGAFALTSTGGHFANENPGSGIFDFTDATWKVLGVPGVAFSDNTYSLASTNGSPNFEIDANQTPAPAHTIGMAVEIPGKGSAVVPGCAITDSAVAGLVVHYQNMRTGVWTRLSNSQRPTGNVNFGYVAYDSTRNRIWLGCADEDARTQLQYYDLADNTWKVTSNYTANFVQFDGRAGPIHVFRGWVVRQGTAGRFFAFNPDEPTNGWPELSVSGASSAVDFSDGFPLNKYAYHPGTGNFYAVPERTGGTTLHKLIPPKNRSVFTGSISGTTLTVSTLQSGAVVTGQAIYSGGTYRGRIISGSGPYTLNQSNGTISLTDMTGQPTPLSGTWAASTLTLPTSLPAHYSFVHDPAAGARGYTATQFVPSIGVLAYFPLSSNSVYLINPEAPGGQVYSTNFSAAENPISEGGIWLNAGPGADGLDWNSIQTTPGKAYAAAFDTASDGSKDAVCQLKRSYLAATSNQFSAGTVFRTAGYSPNVAHEVGVMVNVTIAAHSVTGYECYVSASGSHSMVRWNGAQGNYTILASGNISTVTAPVDGDVFRLENVGGVLSFYQNGVLRTRFTDTTYTGGNPAFNNNPSSGGNAVLSGIGYKSWTGGSL